MVTRMTDVANDVMQYPIKAAAVASDDCCSWSESESAFLEAVNMNHETEVHVCVCVVLTVSWNAKMEMEPERIAYWHAAAVPATDRSQSPDRLPRRG
jgi:hypothetical protein